MDRLMEMRTRLVTTKRSMKKLLFFGAAAGSGNAVGYSEAATGCAEPSADVQYARYLGSSSMQK